MHLVMIIIIARSFEVENYVYFKSNNTRKAKAKIDTRNVTHAPIITTVRKPHSGLSKLITATYAQAIAFSEIQMHTHTHSHTQSRIHTQVKVQNLIANLDGAACR